MVPVDDRLSRRERRTHFLSVKHVHLPSRRVRRLAIDATAPITLLVNKTVLIRHIPPVFGGHQIPCGTTAKGVRLPSWQPAVSWRPEREECASLPNRSTVSALSVTLGKAVDRVVHVRTTGQSTMPKRSHRLWSGEDAARRRSSASKARAVSLAAVEERVC